MRWATPEPKSKHRAHAYPRPGAALCGRFAMTRAALAHDLGLPNRACATCCTIADSLRPVSRQGGANSRTKPL